MKGTGRSQALRWVIATVLAQAAVPHVLAQSRGNGLTPFTEEAIARGINYTPATQIVSGSGAAFIDLDGDGDADIIACGETLGMVAVYENNGAGFFTNRSATSGIPATSQAAGVCAADYDLDGDLDVYISNGNGPNRLMRNDGNFQFTNVAVAAQVDDAGHAQGSAWGDIDHDGLPDLYVSNHVVEANRLYRNNGDGTFTDLATTQGIEGSAPTLQSAFIDFDLDADLDIYVGNDKGESSGCVWQNHMYENMNGSFADVSGETSTGVCLDTMSITVGDFDHNGWPDIVCTNIEPGTALLMNQGDGTFINRAAEAGVQDQGFAGWGAAFIDFDNDGLLDLFVCLQDEANRLYRNPGTWPCTDVAEDVSVDTGGRSYVVSAADVDLDGDLDLLVENVNEPLRLYINHEGDDRNWARFDVVGEGANRYAIGARLDARIGDHWQQRFVQAGANYKTQDELVQHVGLGSAATIDEVVVTWIGGSSRTLVNVPANQTWTVYPLDKCGDADGDGDRDFDDYLAFAACYTGSNPAEWLPGCEIMDYEGDADVDLADFDMFLAEYDELLVDCNNNGVPDLREILAGEAPDDDNDGSIDGCVPTLPGDVDADGTVGLSDLLIILSNWGPCADCPPACLGDADSDCSVGLSDLLAVLSDWGS